MSIDLDVACRWHSICQAIIRREASRQGKRSARQKLMGATSSGLVPFLAVSVRLSSALPDIPVVSTLLMKMTMCWLERNVSWVDDSTRNARHGLEDGMPGGLTTRVLIRIPGTTRLIIRD